MDFCILQTTGADPREWRNGQHFAEGFEGEVLRKREEDLIEEKQEGVRWALPMVAEHHDKILKAVRRRWEGQREGK